ncbi:oligoendopeptidase F [Lactobacillus sp.] [Lactiplantibacillus mudanjiangensis]|uniref:oligoendopeptidase F n=1 Tax=Lactiplantibacillus mudanjiangensis TaxID=1296538 RepID=UPI00101546EB|nr:oligoendopeptidase F [Lactiplantibacillus mudanjiangensis]VDG20793.1 oligoendopeptidase F [Lactobacillus sp.] [Lactiplantibacillus mudanjiangensis]VDG30529.1 oligoendopeptidase F [Lactobacillus sp.] [Lactiplantibacillus mudanjiangensis]
MVATKKLPTRSEVPEALTWDLTLIFADQAAYDQAVIQVKADIQTVTELAASFTSSAETVLAGVQGVLGLYRHLEKVAVYASLKSDQDTGNSTNQALDEQASALTAQVSAATAWFEPALLTLTPSQLDTYLDENVSLRDYRHLFDTIRLQKGHVLSTSEEALLAGASDIFDASAKTFGVLNNADFDFPVVNDEHGNPVKLSQGVYGVLLESVDPATRRTAFKALYQVYAQFRRTLASTLASQVKVHNFVATAHHYPDARTAALAANQIPTSVYDRLVDTVDQHLDLLHRYVALRKSILGVDDLHMYDLYTPLTAKPAQAYTYETAQATALKALKVLGPDYVKHVKTAFSSRWIDVVENQGKRSGAYSSGMYDTAPYMLLNWQDNIDNLYTLVHEMGHSMHSYLTTHHQPYQYGDYSIFVAEIASTTNENLLTNYFLATTTDPKVRAYVLNYYLDGFKGTLFRQTQFAEFEQWLHTEAAAGRPLTADRLSKHYLQLNQRYYGDAVVSDPEIADEWSRIPHFYYNYYVYQYATGFAAASTLAQGISTGQSDAVKKYLGYLQAGSSDFPIDVMRNAGVDMTKATYLEDAFKVFEQRLDEFEQLVKTK